MTLVKHIKNPPYPCALCSIDSAGTRKNVDATEVEGIVSVLIRRICVLLCPFLGLLQLSMPQRSGPNFRS
jgi:hypothetical protein